jgi:type II secretory pathway pseudopilin PulG
MSYSRVRKRPGSQDGVTILETLIAVSILLIVSVGILAMGMVAMTTTENQGHRAARTAEYAQDKTEQLMSLAYTDSTSDTTVFPTANGGGSGLSVGGSADPNAPVAQYVDYLDADGNLQPSGGGAPAGWFYKRVWQISTPAGTTNLKQITVTTTAASGVGNGTAPQSSVSALKTSPF